MLTYGTDLKGLITNAAGTPYQPSQLLVDVMWDTLFVPNASNDLQPWKRDSLQLYYPNKTSTAALSD
ncbi:hypothetical protein PG985_008056 [Apiospora marii]|uniref:Uncharacterized protein n=1 Tax=Apiospora marii TaxID=335849 RepID=A0ABR1RA79_9PEZI